MDASKNELYVTGHILVSLRANDYRGNAIRLPAGNKASSPTLRHTLSPMERVHDGKDGRDVNVYTLLCFKRRLRMRGAITPFPIRLYGVQHKDLRINSQQTSLILR